MLAILFLTWVAGLHAQSTWIGPTDGQWDIATNWSPASVPNAVDAVVVWTNNSQPYLTLGGPFILGTLEFLYGGGSQALGANGGKDLLMAQTSTGAPTIDVTNGGTVYFYAVLSGTQGFNKTGAGTLTFRYNGSAQPFSGNLGILGGALDIQADSSLGNTNNGVTITNGATLSENSGANSGVFWLAPSRTLTLAGAQAELAVGGAAYTLVVPCVITESVLGSGLFWNSAGELVLSNANSFTGPLTLTAGTNDLANANAAQFSTVTVNGGTLLFDQSVTGSAFTLGGLAGSSGTVIALQNTAARPVVLSVGGNSASTTFGGSLAGPGSLIKNGTGSLTFTGTNTYTGTTTIDAGKLVTPTTSLGGGAYQVADGATNSVQVVGLGQTLTNSSLMLGASAGATMEFANSVLANPTAPMIRVGSLALHGTINVNIYGSAFAYAVGTIPLLAYGSKSVSGSGWLLGTLPPGMVASLNDTGSLLQLVISSVSNSMAVETVSFPAGDAGWPINSAFCGLSYEKSQLTGSLFNATNFSLIAMFAQIAPGVLRIGGNSVDTTCWGGVSNLPAITPAQVDSLAGFVNALPTNWHVIYGINMVVNSPTNCAAEAAYAATALGSRLQGFEIGNEPDLYHDWVSADYTYAHFLPQWRALAAGITNAVSGWAITNGGSGWTLTGPASSYNTAGYTMPFATNETGIISMLTQHYYRNSGAATNATMNVLLMPDTNLPGTVSNLVAAATAAHLPQGFRMAESGSFSGGGNTNSSQFGAALWTLDVMFTIAQNGGQGINFHGGGQGSSSYTPIADNGSSVVQARPEFYGLKLFSLASQGSAVPAVLSPSPAVNFSAYGIQQSNGTVSTILINKETNTGVQVTVSLGTNAAAMKMMSLTGASLESTNGFTLGGAPINPDGSWAGKFQQPIPVTNGQFTVLVLPMSAVWLDPLRQPILSPFTNFAVIAGSSVSVPSQASDPNFPPQTLGFVLSATPTGGGINPATGLISWRPAISQSGSSNLFMVVVTNTSNLATTQTFRVGVIAPMRPVISQPRFSSLRFQLTISGNTGPDYAVQMATNLAVPLWRTVSTVSGPVPPFQWTDTNLPAASVFYRILLGP